MMEDQWTFFSIKSPDRINAQNVNDNINIIPNPDKPELKIGGGINHVQT
jgi:hypothetical protein